MYACVHILWDFPLEEHILATATTVAGTSHAAKLAGHRVKIICCLGHLALHRDGSLAQVIYFFFTFSGKAHRCAENCHAFVKLPRRSRCRCCWLCQHCCFCLLRRCKFNVCQFSRARCHLWCPLARVYMQSGGLACSPLSQEQHHAGPPPAERFAGLCGSSGSVRAKRFAKRLALLPSQAKSVSRYGHNNELAGNANKVKSHDGANTL